VSRGLQTKLDQKAQHVIFIEYVKYNMGYQCYNPSGRKITIATNVKFDERVTTSELHLNIQSYLK
jgi:hypothetical protein